MVYRVQKGNFDGCVLDFKGFFLFSSFSQDCDILVPRACAYKRDKQRELFKAPPPIARSVVETGLDIPLSQLHVT